MPVGDSGSFAGLRGAAKLAAMRAALSRTLAAASELVAPEPHPDRPRFYRANLVPDWGGPAVYIHWTRQEEQVKLDTWFGEQTYLVDAKLYWQKPDGSLELLPWTTRGDYRQLVWWKLC